METLFPSPRTWSALLLFSWWGALHYFGWWILDEWMLIQEDQRRVECALDDCPRIFHKGDGVVFFRTIGPNLFCSDGCVETMLGRPDNKEIVRRLLLEAAGVPLEE